METTFSMFLTDEDVCSRGSSEGRGDASGMVTLLSFWAKGEVVEGADEVPPSSVLSACGVLFKEFPSFRYFDLKGNYGRELCTYDVITLI